MTEGSCSRRDLERVKTILGYCEDIECLIQIHGSDESDFQENISLQYGCAFALQQIGEHAKHISIELKDRHKELDWKGMAGLRDIIVHKYYYIDLGRIRSTVLDRIPSLEAGCRAIMDELRQDDFR